LRSLAGIARVGQDRDRTRIGAVLRVAGLPVALRKRGRSGSENKCGNEGESELGQHCPPWPRFTVRNRDLPLASHLRDREQARHGRVAYVVTICSFANSTAEAKKSGRGAHQS
jgi:hypothetical protein